MSSIQLQGEGRLYNVLKTAEVRCVENHPNSSPMSFVSSLHIKLYNAIFLQNCSSIWMCLATCLYTFLLLDDSNKEKMLTQIVLVHSLYVYMLEINNRIKCVAYT